MNTGDRAVNGGLQLTALRTTTASVPISLGVRDIVKGFGRYKRENVKVVEDIKDGESGEQRKVVFGLDGSRSRKGKDNSQLPRLVTLTSFVSVCHRLHTQQSAAIISHRHTE